MRRLLPQEEWHRLARPIKKLFGEDKEVPPASLCAVEEDEQGEIQGFLFLQLIPHLEPFGSLGGVSFDGLRNLIDMALTGIPDMVYYLYVDNPEGEALFTKKGFSRKGVMFEGRVGD